MVVDLPPQDFYLESGGQPKPCQVVRRPGQNNKPDMAFNLHQRIYPNAYASTTDPMDSMSAASHRLLAAKEGHIAIHSGDMEAGQDPLVGNPPGAWPPGHPPLPRHHYEMKMDREAYLHANCAQLGPHKPVTNRFSNL